MFVGFFKNFFCDTLTIIYDPV